MSLRSNRLFKPALLRDAVCSGISMSASGRWAPSSLKRPFDVLGGLTHIEPGNHAASVKSLLAALFRLAGSATFMQNPGSSYGAVYAGL